jgi:uncharacterized protein YyaL (SSP411 family)
VDQDPHEEFIGRNILHRAEPSDPPPGSIDTLLNARAHRPRPHRDEKVLTSWNALMISAFAKGYLVLGEPEWLRVAERASAFLLSVLYETDTARLSRRFCDGDASVHGFLDDYAFFAAALLDLYEATGKTAYLSDSVALARVILADFEDVEHGAYYSTRADASDLVLRMKDDYDGAEPSGNSVAADTLLRLAQLIGEDRFRESAERALAAFAPRLRSQPTMAPQLLVAVDRFLTPAEQTIVRCARPGDEVESLLRPHREAFAPYRVALALSDEEQSQLAVMASFLGSLPRQGRFTVYECKNLTCDLPKIID